jgi:hypothetical protein
MQYKYYKLKIIKHLIGITHNILILLGWETLLGGTSRLVSFTFTRRRCHFILNREGSAWTGGLLAGRCRRLGSA